MKIRNIIIMLLMIIFTSSLLAQEKKDVNKITKEEVLQMTIEELSGYDLEEVMKLMDIAGASSLEELYELLLNKDVTSASKSEESLFDSPLSTTVLSNKEIIASGATSIEEALRLVPGIIVREKSNGNYDVQIRGGQNMPMNNMLIYAENTTTLVMIDGRPVFNYGMGGILWETMPVSLGELDRIEVVRGPSSALYGPNAVNGVINLITKDINKETPIVSANFQGGTLSTYIGDFSVAQQMNDKFSAGISGSLEKRDRNTDEIYAIYADEFLSLEEYDQLNTSQAWSNDDIFKMMDESGIAKDKMGINAYMNYDPNKNMSFNVSGGYLESQANTSTIGDNPTPYNIRSSEGYHLNLIANIYGINIQTSLNNVEQDFCRGRSGWQQSTEQYNATLDYLFKWDKLSFRPGISYQSVYYDDRDHIDVVGTGFFNNRIALRNYAASARFDYHPTEKIRLVAALRSEKYNVPDKWMPSYQFIGSYKINDNNLVRAVYSRANQSTFMINAYSNYDWDRRDLGTPEIVHFGENNNPNMMVMDMIELGFRTRPTKSILLDFELFYNKAKDFSALMPVKTTTEMVVPYPDSPIGVAPLNTTLYTSHRPLDIESKQFGFSINADIVLSEKLVANTHLTYQKSTVDKFNDQNRTDIFIGQITENLMNGPGGPYTSVLQPDPSTFHDDVDNEAMPSFWGSLSLTYKPIDKLAITAQGYYYDKYYLYSQYENDPRRAGLIEAGIKQEMEYSGNVDSKFILNAKVNYTINNNIDVFVNARNMLNNETQEYVFMDKIGALYLAGFNINF